MIYLNFDIFVCFTINTWNYEFFWLWTARHLWHEKSKLRKMVNQTVGRDGGCARCPPLWHRYTRIIWLEIENRLSRFGEPNTSALSAEHCLHVCLSWTPTVQDELRLRMLASLLKHHSRYRTFEPTCRVRHLVTADSSSKAIRVSIKVNHHLISVCDILQRIQSTNLFVRLVWCSASCFKWFDFGISRLSCKKRTASEMSVKQGSQSFSRPNECLTVTSKRMWSIHRITFGFWFFRFFFFLFFSCSISTNYNRSIITSCQEGAW